VGGPSLPDLPDLPYLFLLAWSYRRFFDLGVTARPLPYGLQGGGEAAEGRGLDLDAQEREYAAELDKEVGGGCIAMHCVVD
jgi:hypothetical protein